YSPSIRAGERWHHDRPRAPTLQRRCRSESGDTVETKRAAHRFYGNQDAIAQQSSPVLVPTVRTVTPLSPPPRHLQAKTTHPSPSACKFRLRLNGLATSELRRMFLQLSAGVRAILTEVQLRGFRQSGPTGLSMSPPGHSIRPSAPVPAPRVQRFPPLEHVA